MEHFHLKAKFIDNPHCRLEVVEYPMGGGIAWAFYDDGPDSIGEREAVPTINLIEYGIVPQPGNVLIKMTREGEGMLECLIGLGLVEDTGRRFSYGFDDPGAAEAKVLRTEFLEPTR